MKVAGFGFRASATERSLASALEACGQTVSALAAPDDKAMTPVFTAFARSQNLPVVRVSAETLAAQATETQSLASRDARMTGSVAEASALAAFDGPARLVTTRQISQDRCATCAVAEGNEP